MMELIPYVSVGPIRFGMTRDEVRNVLGPDRGRPDPSTLFFSKPVLLGVEFAADGGCDWVGAEPAADFVVDGLRIAGYNAVLIGLYERNHPVRFGETPNRGSVYCDSLGLYLWRDDLDSDELSAVGAYGRQYWRRAGWPAPASA